MKKILCMLIILAVATLVSAQSPITLYGSDLASPGASFLQYRDTTPIILPGNTGAGISWDFSSLAHHDSTQVNVVLPAATPYGYLFSGVSNEAVDYVNDNLTYYFNKAADGLYMNGFTGTLMGGNDTLRIVFSQPDTMLVLPSTYQTAFTSYVTGDTKSTVSMTFDTMVGGTLYSIPIDSVRLKHYQDKITVFDAYGTLTTPDGSVPALRQYVEQVMTDSAWGYLNFPVPFQAYSGWYYFRTLIDNSFTYLWWTNGVGVPLVRMYYDTTGYATSVEWLHIPNLGLAWQPAASKASVWPNPASYKAEFNSDEAFNSIRLFNITGELVHVQQTVLSHRNQADLTGISDGLYNYILLNDDRIVANGKISIIH